VRDNGIGIPREEMSNIFALYSSTKGSRGTGIGLAVSEKIIREHGGRIRVRSQPGEGTEFILELPLRPETVAGNAPEKLESSEPALTDPECRSAFPG
jgi:signal transduction histidine kinase